VFDYFEILCYNLSIKKGLFMLKRFGIFGLVNIAVIALISMVVHFTEMDKQLHIFGVSYSKMLLFCLCWGLGGSFISLLVSKLTAKISMGVVLVDKNENYKYLVDMVHDLSKKAGIEKMPEVGVYESNDINAFATGPSKNNSLVAVSTGLINSMTRDEIEGVLAHEVAHIANGDMVTMALIQGVMNAFVMFFARVVAQLVLNQIKGNSRIGGIISTFLYLAIVLVLQVAFGLLANVVINWFSRQREYRADAGSAELSSKQKMIMALRRLESIPTVESTNNKAIACMQITSKQKFLSFFSTHPLLSDRIKELQNLK
jgi:heat shock protein HtpX